MSPGVATFAAALFEGRVFDRPDTLKEMFWKGPHQGADQYRMGVFVKRVGDQEFYWHSGFWGDSGLLRAIIRHGSRQETDGQWEVSSKSCSRTHAF